MATGKSKVLFSLLLTTCLFESPPSSFGARPQSMPQVSKIDLGRMLPAATGSSSQEEGTKHAHTAFVAAGSTDTLGNGGNITDGQVLVSANGTFIMGFFSPGASTNRYLGIWFSVSPDVVCWVANRDMPLNSTSGVLSFDAGRLLLVDGAGSPGQTTRWSSNLATAGPAVARLLESGDLAIRRLDDETIIWHSFEHPSDTLLPGMKMGRNKLTHQDWYLTAWRSAHDPSPGTYRDITELDGLPENVLRDDRGVKVYRTGAYNGLHFSGVTEAATYTDLFTFEIVNTAGEVSFGFIAKPGAPLSRIVVTSDGFVRRLVWEASKATWVTYYQGPRDVCDSYSMCGPFGICSANSPSTSFCSCVKGFSPVHLAEWKAKETSGGCQRNLALDCGRSNGSTTDGFLMLQGIKLPDALNASVDTGMTLDHCSRKCLADCLCVAYAPADISDGGAGSGCIMWTDNIIDLRYVDGGQDLYLRLAQPELVGGHTNVNKPSAIMIASVASITGAISIILLLFTIWVVMRKISDRTGRWVPSVSLSTIKRATNDFSDECSIGNGGYGYVYQGRLPKGHRALQRLGLDHTRTTVAFKRMHNRSRQEVSLGTDILQEIKRSFPREVRLMSRLKHHQNVARLLGVCEEGGEQILIYEYAHRGSLETYIFGTTQQRSELTWKTRLEIICGIANGMAHLHRGSDKTVIIHRDLKPANVLLDINWVPKVADFGTAKIFNDETGTRSVIIGTPGYIAPEYHRNAADLTLKCDVHCFGVTLLATIRGNNDRTQFLSNARRLWDEGNDMSNLLEPAIGEPSSDDLPKIRRCIEIGVLCVQETADHRPSMPEVVEMLTNISQPVPEPSPPNGGELAPLLEGEADPPNQETDQPSEAEDNQHNQVTRQIIEVTEYSTARTACLA